MVTFDLPPGCTQEQIASFLRLCGFPTEVKIAQVNGGANNRVYRVTEEQRSAILKVYFRHARDLRDRFGAERAFYEFLGLRGIRRAPMALGWDASAGLGLLEFIPGRKLRPEEVDRHAVEAAASFIVELNCPSDDSTRQLIPAASEACFSLEQHIDCVQKRVDRLHGIRVESETDEEASRFIREELTPSWRRIRDRIRDEAGLRGLDEKAPMDLADRCLSPSDFGFHNALLGDDLQLRFLDFEYAGWDDPAKLICDFFCQPGRPVSLEHLEFFVLAITDGLRAGDSLAFRARLLLPAYRIKWCCIMLNEFLETDNARRLFAAGRSGPKAAQLEKAKKASAALAEL